MIVHADIQQGSDEWFAVRCGKVTASEFSSVLAKGQGKMRASYMRRVVTERLTGKPCETYSNGHTERGQEQEAMARLCYEELSGHPVLRVGFIEDDAMTTGFSPDGLISKDGGCEIKCVIPTVQIETILRGGFPPEHRPQIQGSMGLSGRHWWDFCSYSPDLPENLQCYIFRVQRDEAYIIGLKLEVGFFLDEAAKLEQELRAYGYLKGRTI